MSDLPSNIHRPSSSYVSVDGVRWPHLPSVSHYNTMAFQTEMEDRNTGAPNIGGSTSISLALAKCSDVLLSHKKPVILVMAASYLPGYKGGGPVRSIANLVEAFGDELDFRIVTGDRDLHDSDPYPGIEMERWIKVGKAQVLYSPKGLHSLWKFMTLLRAISADVLYLNSVFDRKYSMLPTLLRRLGLFHSGAVVLAPRGEFSAGALQLKPWRKRVYIAISKAIGLYSDLTWHASSGFEKRDIGRAFGKTKVIAIAGPIASAESRQTTTALKIVTALDIPEAFTVGYSAKAGPHTKPAGSIRLVFLSRICRMKNLDGAVSMLSGLSGQVYFAVYGPAEDHAYWQICQDMISRLPPNIQVTYAGEVRHDLIEGILSQNDLFFLPTHGENYGHVILEALRAGCPLVISDQTPWRNLEHEGVGWDLPLDEPKRFQQALQTCIDMGPEAFAEFSQRARAFGIERSTDTQILEQNKRLFWNALPEHSDEVLGGKIRTAAIDRHITSERGPKRPFGTIIRNNPSGGASAPRS